MCRVAYVAVPRVAANVIMCPAAASLVGYCVLGHSRSHPPATQWQNRTVKSLKMKICTIWVMRPTPDEFNGCCNRGGMRHAWLHNLSTAHCL
ncbi:hypothetical protein EDD22DRAFT_63613 [Suillus occidentalis]|nr:hypothetical protein EDD22DRAFT_63613 [Suillus occidentalis]